MIEALCIILFTASIGISAEMFGVRHAYIAGAVLFLILGIVFAVLIFNKEYRHYYT